jgi:hypothetical protein
VCVLERSQVVICYIYALCVAIVAFALSHTLNALQIDLLLVN